MNNQLIPVFVGSISNETALLCDARELHGFLGVGKVFAAWITARINEYGFVENHDYILTFSKTGKRQNVRCKDYHLTLDTAKELAMVERNDKGRQVRRYFIECEKRLLNNTRQTAQSAEPLSPKDMNNLKRLVWLMTNSMKFDKAWNQGVWYALRSATGRPSPQPFSVEDLPALGEECMRIMKITSAFHSAVYEFEKDVIRKVVRKRGVIEPLLNDMRLKLLELQQQENDGLLMLDKLSEHGIKELVARQ